MLFFNEKLTLGMIIGSLLIISGIVLYALSDSEGNILLLDCGIPIKEIKIGINFQVSKIIGCLVTHSHL